MKGVRRGAEQVITPTHCNLLLINYFANEFLLRTDTALVSAHSYNLSTADISRCLGKSCWDGGKFLKVFNVKPDNAANRECSSGNWVINGRVREEMATRPPTIAANIWTFARI